MIPNFKKMNKILLFTYITITLIYISCSSNDDSTVDTTLSCEDAQAAFEALDENTNCNEALQVLRNNQNACGDEDGEIQAQIDLLEELCALVG